MASLNTLRIALFLACTSGSLLISAEAQGQTPIIDNTVIVSSGLSIPTSLAFLGPNDFLVLERDSGKIKRVQLPGPVITTVLQFDVVSRINGGLMSIVLHPDFNQVGYVYFLFSAPYESGNYVTRYYWDGSRFLSRRLIWSYTSPVSILAGADIAFGPDRSLYITVGATNSNSPTTNSSTTPIRETGCILRLNDDGTTPTDNPFSVLPGWERIYAYGIFESSGLAIDPLTGFLWATDNGHGVGQYDEVNRIIAGFNGGWRQIMGPDYRIPLNPDSLVMAPGATYRNPEFSWKDYCHVTSIAFLHSPRWPSSFRDDCVVGNYGDGNILRLDMTEDRSEFLLTGGFADKVADRVDNPNVNLRFHYVPRNTDMTMGPDGYVYCVSSLFGKIHKIRPRFPMGDINLDQNVTEDDMPLFFDLVLGNSSDPAQITQADFDGDGSVTGLDIQGFVESLRLPN